MSEFLTTLDAKVAKQWTQDSEDNNSFERIVILNQELRYKSDFLGAVVTVPKGFKSDGASVPRAMWSIYPPFGKYLEAAVVHDWFCVLGHKGESPIDYKEAAKVFNEAMEVCCVGKWRRFKMYWAVRLGGPKFSAKKIE
jgi:hypothetical protein